MSNQNCALLAKENGRLFIYLENLGVAEFPALYKEFIELKASRPELAAEYTRINQSLHALINRIEELRYGDANESVNPKEA
jgi:hypothetical protein